jgi:hypothetical protein
MGLKDVDLGDALRRLAERRIEDAMREGKFDNLAGKGRPLDLEPMPADENARMTWWMLRILKGNDFTPDEVRWRKQLDGLRAELVEAGTEARVRAIVGAINRLVRQVNTLGTNALPGAVAPVSLEEELQRWRERVAAQSPQAAPSHRRVAGAGSGIRTCRNPACKTRDPGTARYCRRCGAGITPL